MINSNVLISLLVLFLITPASFASQFTPLPLEMRITPPLPDLPKHIAGFSGTWYGSWDGIQSTTLVVERVNPPEIIAVYSWGKIRDIEGGWRRYIGKIEPDKRKITVVSEKDLSITYTLSDDGEKLEGEYRRPSKSQVNYVIMERQPPSTPVAFPTEETFTPLPVNVKIIDPNPELPEGISVFSGAWHGTWDNGRATTLIVERIEPPEAIAVYSWGPWKKQEGGWKRYIGEIKQGKLKLHDPEREITIIYLLSKEGLTLEGTWERGWTKLKATMRRK